MKWESVNDDSRMPYERSSPMHFQMGGSAYVSAGIWKKCDGCGSEFMGEDSLLQHLYEAHWDVPDDPPEDLEGGE